MLFPEPFVGAGMTVYHLAAARGIKMAAIVVRRVHLSGLPALVRSQGTES